MFLQLSDGDLRIGIASGRGIEHVAGSAGEEERDRVAGARANVDNGCPRDLRCSRRRGCRHCIRVRVVDNGRLRQAGQNIADGLLELRACHTRTRERSARETDRVVDTVFAIRQSDVASGRVHRDTARCPRRGRSVKENQCRAARNGTLVGEDRILFGGRDRTTQSPNNQSEEDKVQDNGGDDPAPAHGLMLDDFEKRVLG